MRDLNRIYVVTLVASIDPTIIISLNRTLAWFGSLVNADWFIVSRGRNLNFCGAYPYCVIEGVEEGPMGCVKIASWYEWDWVEGQYVECDNPGQEGRVYGIG